METLSILSLLLVLTNCAGENLSSVKFGKRCTQADANGLKESSFIWIISQEAQAAFNSRINKANCSDS